MAPGASSSTTKNGERTEAADTKKLSEIIPSWLQIPTKYYETLGTNIRGSLFYFVGKDILEPNQLAYGAAILNLFQLSAVILDDICDNSSTRRSQPTIHQKFGREKSLVWSFGLCFHIHDYIMKEAPDQDFAWKMIQLYDRMSSLTLEGQYYDLDWGNTNFKQIAELKTSYYTTCFPVAMLVLMKTGDLPAALKVMDNKSLLEVGYWFQAENDFKGTFLDTNTDIENRTWTLLIQMLAEKYAEGSFEYPTTHEESIALYKEYDIYDQYVRTRQAWLKRLKTMEPEPTLTDQPELSEIVQRAKKFSLEYFLKKYILRGYTFKNLDLTAGVQTHSKAEELNRQLQDWAEAKLGADFLKLAYGPSGAKVACDWVNKAFSFIKEPATMLSLHKMNVMCLIVENIATRHAGFLDDMIEMATHELSYPQYEVVVVSKKYGADGPVMQPLFWHLCLTSRDLAKAFRTNVDCANDPMVEWFAALRDLHANWSSLKSMDAYYKLRSTALCARMFYNYGAAYKGKNNDAVLTPLVDALCKIYVLQYDLCAYGQQVEVFRAKVAAAEAFEASGAVGGEPAPPISPVINAIEMYKKLNPKKAAGMVEQDIVDELQAEEESVLAYSRSFKGTNNEYMTVMQPGMADRLGKKYEKSFVASKNTGWVRLP